MVCLALAIGGFTVSPRGALAQSVSAYAVVPKLPGAIVTIRPGERLTLGQLVNAVPLFPDPIVTLASAAADGGVRLNDTAGITRSTLAELLSTVVTASSDGTVTLIVDALVRPGGVPVITRSVGVLRITFIASPTRYRVTPKESPFRMNAGSAYRLRDLVTFEKLDQNALIQNFGFEVTGGVACTRPSAATTPVACPRISTDLRYGGVSTEGMLDSGFVASASGRISLGVYVIAPAGGDPIERFVIDVEVDVPTTRQGLIASTDASGPATTTLGATDPAPTTPTTLAPVGGTASSSAVPTGQNNASATTRPKPKPKPKSKSKSTSKR